ncbi:transposase [Streptacidiphilus sp. PAMC 29251]
MVWRSDERALGQAGVAVAGGPEAGRPPVWSKRQLINGIRRRTRTGAPWRDVPTRYVAGRGCVLVVCL